MNLKKTLFTGLAALVLAGSGMNCNLPSNKSEDNSLNKQPTLKITNPINNAGVYREPTLYLLDASCNPGEGNSIQSQGWNYGGLNIEDSNDLNTYLTIPKTDELGTYVFTAHCTDNKGRTVEEEVIINLLNHNPIANAGDYISISPGDIVTLDATNSIDLDGDYTCQWDFESDGIYDSDSCKVDVSYGPGCHFVRLKVTDNNGASAWGVKIINSGYYCNR